MSGALDAAIVPAGDAALLSRLHSECFAQGWSEQSFAGLLANASVLALVHTGGLGFIVIQVAADEAEILTIGVRAAARRRGIGAALLEAALESAYKRDARAMFLEVDCANYQAIALYKGHGFGEAGRRKGYYDLGNGQRSDALTLRVEIRAPRVGNCLQLG
jgi:ribosomal-protein-alanine acetyltransferase